MIETVLQGYEAASADLIDKFEAIKSAELFAHVQPLLPPKPSRILDVGAGTGRDAAWFATFGHTVVAVEPVASFRMAGSTKHKAPNIEWVNDTLPSLSRLISREDKFNFIVLSAVWQHLENKDRQRSLAALRKLASDGCTVVISIRHGEGAPTRQVYPASVADAQFWAEQIGFKKVFEVSTQSAQQYNRQAGVTWTWIALQAPK